MTLLYNVRYGRHSRSWDMDRELPVPMEAGWEAECTNGRRERYKSIRNPNPTDLAERKRLLAEIDARIGLLKKRYDKASAELEDQSYGALLKLIGITSRDCDRAGGALNLDNPAAYEVRAWVDMGRPELPPEFVWAEDK